MVNKDFDKYKFQLEIFRSMFKNKKHNKKYVMGYDVGLGDHKCLSIAEYKNKEIKLLTQLFDTDAEIINNLINQYKNDNQILLNKMKLIELALIGLINTDFNDKIDMGYVTSTYEIINDIINGDDNG